MKIGFTGIELPEGSTKYQDDIITALTEKDTPKKVSPFYVTFIRDEFSLVDAIVIPKEHISDILIPDIEKFENRCGRSEDETEKQLLQRCIALMEKETPLYDMKFTEEELKILRVLETLSLKPILQLEKELDTNSLITAVLEKSGTTFFYTSGKNEVHAWHIKKGLDIVSCAGKIHKDLARGFIRADIVSVEDYISCHNMNEAKQKGLVRTVDKNYIIQEREIVDIRFSV